MPTHICNTAASLLRTSISFGEQHETHTPSLSDMFSLQRFFGRSELFFDLLEQSALEARESVDLIKSTLINPTKGQSPLDEFALLRKKDKRITEEIREAMRQVANVENSEAMLRDALALLGARRAG